MLIADVRSGGDLTPSGKNTISGLWIVISSVQIPTMIGAMLIRLGVDVARNIRAMRSR